VLADLLTDMHDASGRVTLPGFYERVITPRLGQLAQWRALDFDGAAFLGAVGLTTPAGEEGMSVIEQLWSRPTAEINGIFGGYTGPGTKTVIPSHATAKLSFRLVPNQQPAQILDGLHRFIAERLPADCTVTYAGEGGSPAVGFDTSTPIFQAAANALEQEWGKQAALIGCGASIPIVESFRSRLGMDSLLVGFALDDDRIHAPNEKYNVKSFTKGARSWARLLDELGAIDGNLKA
jgi:acetylornithine deacetylase/succinyl-diaminopimelate desuccinylase-like protein